AGEAAGAGDVLVDDAGGGPQSIPAVGEDARDRIERAARRIGDDHADRVGTRRRSEEAKRDSNRYQPTHETSSTGCDQRRGVTSPRRSRIYPTWPLDKCRTRVNPSSGGERDQTASAAPREA